MLGFLLVLSFILFFSKAALFLIFLLGTVAAAFLLVIIGTNSIGIEFVTFPSLIFLYKYGWVDASLFAVVALFLYMFITRSVGINMFLAFGIVPLLLLALVPLKSLGIFPLGMILSIAGNGVFTGITIMFGTTHLHKRLIYFATHVVWSWFLFGTFGERVLQAVM